MKDPIREHEDGVLFDITVKPGSARQAVRAGKKGIVVSVKNLPVKNRANREIIQLLSSVLDRPVSIHKSAKNYHKTILVPGATIDEVRCRMTNDE